VALLSGAQLEAHEEQVHALSAGHTSQIELAHEAAREAKGAEEVLQRQVASEEAAAASIAVASLTAEMIGLEEVDAVMHTQIEHLTNRLEATEDTLRRSELQFRTENGALRKEIERLQKVQDTVLGLAGGLPECDALPGGEARRFLFYEAMKRRSVPRPEASVSWRGQLSEPTAAAPVTYSVLPWHVELRGGPAPPSRPSSGASPAALARGLRL